MDQKSLDLLEYPKILARVAGYCAFPVSAERARAMRPETGLEQARRRQAETREAVQLLATRPELTIGGARDVRAAIELARHGGALTPPELLDLKSTLVAARTLVRLFERQAEAFPHLTEIAAGLEPPSGLVDAISQTLSDRGEVLDNASPRLALIRRDLQVTHDRLLSRLQRLIGDPKIASYLQETLITQRDGRYVIPLRAEFKGKVKAVVHDQSSSGATLFVEPLTVVEANNAYRELQLDERDEILRILSALSGQIGAQGEALLALLDGVAGLDLIFARARYAEELGASEPRLHALPPKGQDENARHPGSVIRLYQARHPLLAPESVVPIDIELDPQTYALIITGPNTGGKTVTLKTVGLLVLMAQSGLHLPVQSGAELSVFEAVYADIGDEQSIEQSLSTFSGHITNIIHILASANRRSLVILDELGAGTDPQEGAALARALLSHILGRGLTTLVTTHHPELKAYAHATPGVVNASVEFNVETLQPTYHLTIGLPGRSNALAIAARLGMPDDIIRAARSELNPTELRAEDLLDEIHRQRDLARQARTAAETACQEAETRRGELRERLEAIEDERREILADARCEAQAEVESLEREIRQVRRELARARQPLEIVEAARQQSEQLARRVAEPVVRRDEPAAEPELYRPVRLGDKVRLRALNTQGVVTGLSEEEAEVQVGVLRVRARLGELAPVGADPESGRTAEKGGPPASPAAKARKTRPEAVEARAETRSEASPPDSPEHRLAASPGMELDLRGLRADEALDAMERYLDAAYLSGMPFVRLIHGKGTGKLRQVVRQALGGHPHVTSFEGGRAQEGGEGVTVAKLRQN